MLKIYTTNKTTNGNWVKKQTKGSFVVIHHNLDALTCQVQGSWEINGPTCLST